MVRRSPSAATVLLVLLCTGYQVTVNLTAAPFLMYNPILCLFMSSCHGLAGVGLSSLVQT